ncbi:MAG: alpha-hydroxy acid oxidase [Bacteroidota bacterium]|nr:alpha-hydroxy acid oxidase [Bacteroidota bacterium]MEC7876452.1 alpha-hydroxy acid oxidase [Bacteroidota bacterium]MEC8367304.1 alpha-hydroxy acid oxidase [Bacteroidota bacterium]MEC8602261.1 alpha-hydroxy acid oxidase [Bacteroidota bacterium]|tara:strand:- start:5260 stop:6408 length:1149 start_codon:yes stop_codon:yes gene_type:complete
MKSKINYKFPSVEDLRKKAKSKIPKFAFEYLDGGCNDDVNLRKNTDRIRDIELKPKYLVDYKKPDLKSKIFGHTYDAPFGISPVGLQGLMWPKSPEILAKAAFDHNIPFILSTVTTASIEKISEITEGRSWFQLYHPAEEKVTKDILRRASEAQCPVLIILADVPSFGYRPRDIRNGLSMPPKMTFNNIINAIKRPDWLMQTIINGQPSFEILKPYMPKNLNLSQLGKFMDATFSGRLNDEKIKKIRDLWKGKLVLKGAESLHDVEKAQKLGLDGVIISNHGGRQVDVGQATVDSLKTILPIYKGKIKIMMDSGIRGGADVARVMATGADFSFMGRTFMYGVSALGKKGGNHTISMLKKQLTQVMEQLSCGKVSELQQKLIK